MKKYYSKTLGVEAFALDVAQLDILKKAGYACLLYTSKGNLSYRCFAPGSCQGYTVGLKRFNPFIPAWCPKLERSYKDE